MPAAGGDRAEEEPGGVDSAGEVHPPLAGRDRRRSTPASRRLADPPLAREAQVREVDRAGHRAAVIAGADFAAEPEREAVGGAAWPSPRGRAEPCRLAVAVRPRGESKPVKR